MIDYAEIILEANMQHILQGVMESIDSGIVEPVIVIADLRDRVGAMFAESEGNNEQQITNTINKFASEGMVPTMLVGIPMASFRSLYEAMHDKPCSLKTADHGTFYAAVITGGRTKIAQLPIPASLKPSVN